MGHNYKPTTITRIGFEYQDLVAIETLLAFYRDPARYQWVEIEASDPSFKAVDDVVACLADGRYELTQVKFAVDPDNPDTVLNWDWLLAKKPKGKSLLQCWSDGVAPHVAAGRLATAQLKTDRKPDPAFNRCLVGQRVDYAKIPPDIRAKIETQLGSDTVARAFFGHFDFMHSQPVLENLEAALWARISSDTDRAGFALFQRQVQLWATQKNWPHPDGKVRHVHLQQAFSTERAKPLPQGFRVPADYRAPDADFADRFSCRARGKDGTTVLWAPPGRGKSTFLSHFTSTLNPEEVVCIRHHYFLSLDDRSEGRFHVQAIARSLEAQLEEAVPGMKFSRRSVGEMIEQAAEHIVSEGKRLIVIIDGLDHVWREGRSQEHTEELFNALIAVVPGVHLVVGTQKIAEAHLPARLLAAAPMSGWVELPLMNRAVVHAWVQSQHKAGRLNVFEWPHQATAKALAEVSDAFADISAGLPLHLIYSFEAAARSGDGVTPDIVQTLPACPTGDIRDYYATFLVKLSARGKAILHVLAGLDFAPPPFALNSCFGVDDQSILGLAEIGHLLDFRETEVRPFHGSLFAFLQDAPDHDALFMANSAPTLDWLEREAPPYWREAWLWITQARRGDVRKLIEEPTRDWALSFVAAGYPIDRMINVLDHAETASFDAFNLAAVARHRMVKTRALNSRDLLNEELSQVWQIAARLSDDPFVPAILRADLPNLPPQLIPALVQMTDVSQRTDLVDRAIAELNGRLTQNGREEHVSNDRQGELARTVVSVVAASDKAPVKRVLAFAGGTGHPDAVVAAFAKSARLVGSPELVFETAKTFSGPDFNEELFVALCLEGLSSSAKAPLKGATHPAIRCLTLAKGDTVKGTYAGRDLAGLFKGADGLEDRFQTDIRGMLYRAFMSALAAGLAGKTVKGWVKIPDHAARSWLAGAARAFEALAQRIASRWVETKRWPTLGEVFDWYGPLRDQGQGFDANSRFIAVRLALIDAAFDLCLIGRGLDAAYVIDAAALAQARTSVLWLDELWLAKLTTRRVALHDTDSAEAFLTTCIADLARRVTEFQERADAFGKMALAADDHALPAIASNALQRSVDCLLGYGWRKDPFASEVLEALEMMIEVGDADAKRTLMDLAGAFHRLTDYTDGKGTTHIRSSYYEAVAKHYPEKTAAILADLIRMEDWHYAEDLYKSLPALAWSHGAEGVALLSTYVMPDERAAVEEIETLASVSDQLRRKVGPSANPPPTNNQSASAAAETDAPPPEPGDYPPGKLAALIEERNRLHIYDSSRSPIKDWLDHWDGEGHGLDALADLEQRLSQIRLHIDIDSGLDSAADLAAKVHGRGEAFKWLIRAHIVRYGWHSYLTSRKEAEARLDVVARDYKARWKEFIRETSKPAPDLRESKNGVVIGFTRLIYFLLKLGEFDLAKGHTTVMVETFRAELAQQPVGRPPWA